MGSLRGWIVGAADLLRHPSRDSLKLLVPVALVLGKNSVPTTWNRVTNEPTLTPSG